MSIRAEEAAAEASRFSLRDSFFGDGAPRQVQAAVNRSGFLVNSNRGGGACLMPAKQAPISYVQTRTQIQPTPQLPIHQFAPPDHSTAPPIPHTAVSLSFNSLMGAKSHTGAAQQAMAKNIEMQQTMQAIAMISEQQKMRTAFGCAPSMQMSSSGTASISNRTLPSGFINGGNQRVDSQAEVLRLSATVDSLNGKLTTQSDRLQRTEASLIRANRLMTSERATSNARLLRMQTEVKDLRSREATIRESAIAQAHREAQKPTSVFKESVKRAEEYDFKLAGLEQTVHTISEEKASLATRISTISVELQRSVARADAAEAKLSASEDGGATDSATNLAQIAELWESIQSTTAAKDELARLLADTEIKHAQVLSELDAAKADAVHSDATSAQPECAAHGESRKLLKAEVCSLLEKNNALQSQLDDILAVTVYATEETSDNTDTDTDGAIETGESTLETLTSRLHTADAAFHTALCEVVDSCPDTKNSKGYKRIGKLAKERHRLQAELSKQGRVPFTDADCATDDVAMAMSLRAELHANQAGLRVVGHGIGCYSENDEAGRLQMEQWMMEMSRTDMDRHSEQDLDDEYDAEQDHTEPTACTIRFQSPPSKLQTQTTRGTHAQHPVASRIATAMNRAGHGKRIASCGVNPMSGFRIGRAKFNSGIEAASNAMFTTGGSTDIPPDVAALIEAVSKDISERCMRQRHSYLSEAGMSPQEIQEDLAIYS